MKSDWLGVAFPFLMLAGLAVVIPLAAGCSDPSAPPSSDDASNAHSKWRFEIGDKVMHDAEVPAVVVNRRYNSKKPAPDDNNWEIYCIRYNSAHYGISEDWVLAVELEPREEK